MINVRGFTNLLKIYKNIFYSDVWGLFVDLDY